MLVYHGSYLEIKNPDIFHSRKNLDFGEGFYTTTIYDQALRWSLKFKKNNLKPIISIYELSEKAFENLKILKFENYSDEWLDYVINCRKGLVELDYDIVMGGVANDKVFNTLELFFDGLIEKHQAIKRLKYEKPNMQICFRTLKSLQYLKFKGSDFVEC